MTANEIFTWVIAGYGALVATIAAVIGGIALVQTRSHFGQPNWNSNVGAVWSDPLSVITWRLENFGPREAKDVSLFARPPGWMSPNAWRVWRGGEEHHVFTRSNWVAYVESIDARQTLGVEIDATNGQSQIAMPVGGTWGMPTAVPGEPLYGKWRFRLEWRADPKPQKVRRKFQTVTIKRDFKQTHAGQ